MLGIFVLMSLTFAALQRSIGLNCSVFSIVGCLLLWISWIHVIVSMCNFVWAVLTWSRKMSLQLSDQCRAKMSASTNLANGNTSPNTRSQNIRRSSTKSTWNTVLRGSFKIFAVYSSPVYPQCFGGFGWLTRTAKFTPHYHRFAVGDLA